MPGQMNQRDTIHSVIVIIIAHWWHDVQTTVMQMNSTTIALWLRSAIAAETLWFHG